MEETTEIALTASKPKKQRSEAQINATKRALEALQAKRKENWEKKKEDLASNLPKEQPKEEIKQAVPLKETMEKIVNKQATITDSSEVPEWAKAMYEKIEKLSNRRDKEPAIKKKQKKRVIIEESESESESSDEEIVIKKKKKNVSPAPTTTPTIQPPNENPLRKLLNRR